MDMIFVMSPDSERSLEGTGTRMRVPRGFPSSSIRTTLLDSKRGHPSFEGIRQPTIQPLRFCPAIAIRTLSPEGSRGRRLVLL